jgi:hypothetical protein
VSLVSVRVETLTGKAVRFVREYLATEAATERYSTSGRAAASVADTIQISVDVSAPLCRCSTNHRKCPTSPETRR